MLRRLVPADPVAASYNACGAYFLMSGLTFLALGWASLGVLHLSLGAVFVGCALLVRRLSRPGLWPDPVERVFSHD